MKRPRIRYSPAELAFVEARGTVPRRALHAAFVEAFGRQDVDVVHLAQLCKRRGWTTGRRWWTAAEDAVLRVAYPDLPTATIAGALARPVPAVYNRAQDLGVAKSVAYLASPAAGRTNGRQGIGSRFPKGHVPANKDVVRGRGWAPGRMREGQFKPGARSGQAARHWMPIGSEREVDGYRYTKVRDEKNVPHTVNWKATHHLRWIEQHGPVPAGMVLKCLSGDTRNTDPSNWTLIPRALLPRLNGGRNGRLAYDDAPAELKPTIMAAAKLVHAARERGKVAS